MKLGSLFSGIGGFELGLERAIPGLETVWQVEQEPFCQKVLKKHWPKAKIYDDVRDVNKNNLEPVDILCGGFPCTDISRCWTGEGLDGKKSGLWWEMHRIIGELRPRIAVMENVPTITFRGLDSVLGSLSEIGYDAEWCVISAQDFGAPHIRNRWFCVAYPNRKTRSEDHQSSDPNNNKINPGIKSRLEQERNKKTQFSFIGGGCSVGGINKRRSYWERFPIESPLSRRDDGIPNRMVGRRALGNAIVPQCSEWIGQQILNSGLLEGVE